MRLSLQQDLSRPSDNDVLVGIGQTSHTGNHSSVGCSSVNSPFGVTALHSGIVILGLELGGHRRGKQASCLDNRGRDDSNNLDGKVVAYMDDSTGKRETSSSVCCLEAGDLVSDFSEGRGRGRSWVGVHRVHFGRRGVKWCKVK